MTIKLSIPLDQKGFVLIVSLMLMVLLGVLGMVCQHAGTMELRITANEKFYTMAFFEADGSSDLAVSLLEKNLTCGNGFSGADEYDGAPIEKDQDAKILNEWMLTRNFWLNERAEQVFMPLTEDEVSALLREPAEQEIPDLIIPGLLPGQAGGPRTLITIAGDTRLSPGSAMQMASGYEGVGRSAANRGTLIMFDITARHIGLGAGEATIHQQWRHVIGTEEKCEE